MNNKTMVTNPLLIEVKGLKKFKSKRTLLNIERFSLAEAEVVSLLGANGSGKSTFLRVLAAIEEFDEGVLSFFGSQIVDKGMVGNQSTLVNGVKSAVNDTNGKQTSDFTDLLLVRRRISLVLQKPYLLDISVFENVKTGLKFRNYSNTEASEIAHQWLEIFNVSHLQKRNGHELSGGEAQRVSLARSFAVSPDILLLDEPFSQLDQPARNSLMKTLLSVIDEKKQSVILVTHERKEASYFSSRVAVISNGTILQDGIIEDVFSNPCCSEVEAFVTG